MPTLFEPLTLGAVTTPNRVLMAPLTRMRATVPGDVPNELMQEYYVQRASAGLVISEGTQISPEGKGYMDTPGIYSDAQVTGWRTITDAVHAAGGRIAAQLWHVGRVSHESFHGGAPPVSASAAPYRNRTTVRGEDGRPTRVACPTPRALGLEEIPRLLEDYRRATVNAREAGFDLVEIHGAHGYLLHQFLAADSNRREDAYGGSLENRARLMLEVTDAVASAWSPDRVGIRISPIGSFNGTEDPEGAESGLYVARELAGRGLAFLHLSEPDWAGGPQLDDAFRRDLRGAYRGPIVGAGNYDVDKAQRLLDAGMIDAAAFGRAFIANPDLPRRLEGDLGLNASDPETFYGGGEAGYTDYPAYA
ncbi:MAG: N-ethylmaleimide reductase [uncultured Nocardioides sp.]|uniref:N-ethylmaleimide reductase n=1 Tax=uncultured Nocardioides sp. TaxID=198441 RepID=A0A6J4N9H7_9ACTN|nr:MAG: N-ethylmaleimide reductase [uncultured Nocardioides sp.]